MPWGSLEERRRRSAGKNWLLRILTMSPTITFVHFIDCQLPSRNTGGGKGNINDLTDSIEIEDLIGTWILFLPILGYLPRTLLLLISPSARCRFYKMRRDFNWWVTIEHFIKVFISTKSYYSDTEIWQLTKSSMISLTAETNRMKSSGTAVVYRPVGDTSGICWRKNTYCIIINHEKHTDAYNIVIIYCGIRLHSVLRNRIFEISEIVR